jgi:hypothetical protein
MSGKCLAYERRGAVATVTIDDAPHNRIEAAGLRDHLLTVNGQRSSCVDYHRDQAAIGGKLRVIFSFV